MYGREDGRTDGQTNGRTDRRTDERTDEEAVGRKTRRMDGRTCTAFASIERRIIYTHSIMRIVRL